MVEQKTTITTTTYGTPYYDEDRNSQLAAAGYGKSRHNQKALKKSGGLVEKAKAYLAERKLKKERKNVEKYLPRIRDAGYEPQHNELAALGFTNPKKNLRVLKKTKGDSLKARELLGKKKGVLVSDWISGAGYDKQNADLVSAGYTRPNRNFQALEQNNGDYEKARRYLDERKLKKRAVVYTYPVEYDQWNTKLVADGYKHRNKNLKALRKADGDYEKARLRLQEKNQKYLDAVRTNKYDEAYAELVAAGYIKPRRNLKYLTRASGDVAKAKQALAEKKAKRDAYKIETKTLGYDDNVAALEAAGFRKHRRNYKALQQNNGDVEKAKIYLLERKRNKKLQNYQNY